MLTLTRKRGETIRVGEDVVIRVTRIRGRNVEISIDAPKDVKILRGELPPQPPASKEPEPAPLLPVG